jgi:DNA-binding NtrC family response regulator
LKARELPTGLTTALTGDPSSFQIAFNKLDFEANKEEFEKQFLIAALKQFKGRINQTAIHANIPKKTLLRKLEKYGIVAREYSDRNLPPEPADMEDSPEATGV